MPKTFIPDAEMAQLENKGQVTIPKFIPDAEAGQFFGGEETPKQTMMGDPYRAPSLLKTAKGVIPSAGRFIADIYGAVRHPVETVKAVGAIGAGAVGKLIPGEQFGEQQFDAVTDFFKKRYGSIPALRETLETDPVGVASDIATVITAGGAVLKGTGTIAKSSKLTQFGSSVQKAGIAAEPVTLAIKGTGVVGKAVVGKVVAPFVNMVDFEIQKIATQRGIDLPIGAQTTSKFVQFQEVLASKGIFGRKVAEVFDVALNKIADIGDNVIRKTGGIADDTIAGKAIIEGIQNQKQQFIRTKNALYEKIIPLKGKGVPIVVNADETVKILKVFVEELKRGKKITGLGGDLSLYEKLIAELSKKSGANKLRGLQAVDVRQALQRLNNLVQQQAGFVSTGDNARRMKVIATLSGELDNALKLAHPELAQAITEANQFFTSNVEQLNSRLARRIKAVSNQPDKVFNIVTQSNTGFNEIEQILSVLTPDDLANLQATALKKIIDNATSKTTGHFTASSIQREIEKIGRSKAELIFEPNQLKALDDIDALSKAVDRVGKIAGGSQTAFLQRSLTETIGAVALAFKSPPLAIALLLGDFSISKFLTSNFGRKLLLEGIDFTRASLVAEKLAPVLDITERGLFQTGRAKRAVQSKPDNQKQ